MEDKMMDEEETLWGQPFALMLVYCLLAGISCVVLVIGYWNLNPNNQVGKFLIGVAFLVSACPFTIKFIFPKCAYERWLREFLCLDRKPEGITYYAVMDYLGQAATIAFGYTVAMFVKWKTTLIDSYCSELVLAAVVVLYVFLSSCSLMVLMQRIGWEDRKLIATPVLFIAFVIMVLFIKVGLAAVTSVKDV